jgi:hypothetical protein
VPDLNEDAGYPLDALSGAYILGAVAIACCIRLVILAADDGAVTGEHFVWLAVCVVAAAFSAACAVHVGLKAAESRWRDRA